jgi:HSP20 family protein
MLLRSSDPFREIDRIASQLLGTSTRPAVMPMDAWREGDRLVLEFDLPGVHPESVDVSVERNVLTLRAERAARNGDWQLLSGERPSGHFSRSIVLGDNLNMDDIDATFTDGVLRLVVPVAEKAMTRRVQIRSEGSGPAALNESSQPNQSGSSGAGERVEQDDTAPVSA